MRIAYLNIWGETASETHTGHTLKIVAKRLGIEIIPCRNSADVEACAPDFAIVMSRTQAKLTRCPTYVCVNEPSTVYFRDPKILQNFLTFDGYLALADSLKHFTQHAMVGIGRTVPVGTYYNSAHRQDKHKEDEATLHALLTSGTAKVTYFGTNWDARRIAFFHMFGNWNGAEIYGPEKNWSAFAIPNYKGEVAYDGVGVQEVYRRNGIGLNVLGDHHLQEDVISNRVFEITSVGAVCISCRMPWLEKEFGDSLYYIDQNSTNTHLLEQVQAVYAHILAHPDEAFEKAQRARRIFEEKFSLDIMVQHAIEYHQARIAQKASAGNPLISVIIRSDGTNVPALQRALNSIAAQECGRFQVLVVSPKNITGLEANAIELKIIKGSAYADAYAHIKGDYVAFLREDHEWFAQHIRRHLDMQEEGAFTHSALVHDFGEVAPESAWIGNKEPRMVTHQLDVQGKDTQSALDLICFYGVLAPAALIKNIPPAPELGVASQEKDIVMHLLAHARPRQSFASTVLLHRKEMIEPGSADALEVSWLMLRHWRDKLNNGGANSAWDAMTGAGYRARAFRFDTQRNEQDGVVNDALKFSRFKAERLKPIALPWLKEQSFFRGGLTLTDEANLAMAMQTNETKHGVQGFIAFPQGHAENWPLEYLLVLEATVEKGQFAVHLMQNEKTLERYNIARSFPEGKSYRLEIPIYHRPEVVGLVIDISPNTVARITGIRAYEG